MTDNDDSLRKEKLIKIGPEYNDFEKLIEDFFVVAPNINTMTNKM